MKKILFLAATVLLFWSSVARAQGPYVGGDIVYNWPVGPDIKYLNGGLGLDFTFGYNFGPVALEGNLIGSRHSDSDPDYGHTHADFSGFSLDLRVFLSPIDRQNHLYFLVGFGSYHVDEFDPRMQADTTLSGNGWNIGTGLEHYVNEHAAINFAVIYRLIRFDDQEVNARHISLNPHENGDTVSIQAGVNFHW